MGIGPPPASPYVPVPVDPVPPYNTMPQYNAMPQSDMMPQPAGIDIGLLDGGIQSLDPKLGSAPVFNVDPWTPTADDTVPRSTASNIVDYSSTPVGASTPAKPSAPPPKPAWPYMWTPWQGLKTTSIKTTPRPLKAGP